MFKTDVLIPDNMAYVSRLITQRPRWYHSNITSSPLGIKVFDASAGLAHPHSPGSSTSPFSLSSFNERAVLPVTSQLDCRSSLSAFPAAQNTESSTHSLAHCSVHMRADFPLDRHLDEANMLRFQHREEKSGYRLGHFTQWTAHPSFTGPYVWL